MINQLNQLASASGHYADLSDDRISLHSSGSVGCIQHLLAERQKENAKDG
jgi:hypothetical protein